DEDRDPAHQRPPAPAVPPAREALKQAGTRHPCDATECDCCMTMRCGKMVAQALPGRGVKDHCQPSAPRYARAVRLIEAQRLWDAEPGWLNTASYGLPPRPAWDALQRALADWRAGRGAWEEWTQATDASRRAFARLIGVPAAGVSVGATVSQLLAPVAAALPDRARVLAPEIEFTSNLYPWLAQGGRGSRYGRSRWRSSPTRWTGVPIWWRSAWCSPRTGRSRRTRMWSRRPARTARGWRGTRPRRGGGCPSRPAWRMWWSPARTSG